MEILHYRSNKYGWKSVLLCIVIIFERNIRRELRRRNFNSNFMHVRSDVLDAGLNTIRVSARNMIFVSDSAKNCFETL